MNIVSGCRKLLGARGYGELAAYRYRVFVEHLGWELGCPPEQEADQFDREDTVYVVSRTDEGDINGCARLLPTSRPYLLQEVFPQLLNGAGPPAADDIWELSRFTAVDLAGLQEPGGGRFSSPVAVALLHESIACAARLGAPPDHRISARCRALVAPSGFPRTPGWAADDGGWPSAVRMLD